MRIQNTPQPTATARKPQTTNFKAIRITELDLTSKEAQKLYLDAVLYQITTRRGKIKTDKGTTYNNYITTIEGSGKELSTIERLKKLFAHKTEIKVESCPDTEAIEAIQNFGKK